MSNLFTTQQPAATSTNNFSYVKGTLGKSACIIQNFGYSRISLDNDEVYQRRLQTVSRIKERLTKAQEALAQKEAYAQQVQEDVLEYNRCLVSREEYLTERQENLMKKIQTTKDPSYFDMVSKTGEHSLTAQMAEISATIYELDDELSTLQKSITAREAEVKKLNSNGQNTVGQCLKGVSSEVTPTRTINDIAQEVYSYFEMENINNIKIASVLKSLKDYSTVFNHRVIAANQSGQTDAEATSNLMLCQDVQANIEWRMKFGMSKFELLSELLNVLPDEGARARIQHNLEKLCKVGRVKKFLEKPIFYHSSLQKNFLKPAGYDRLPRRFQKKKDTKGGFIKKADYIRKRNSSSDRNPKLKKANALPFGQSNPNKPHFCHYHGWNNTHVSKYCKALAKQDKSEAGKESFEKSHPKG